MPASLPFPRLIKAVLLALVLSIADGTLAQGVPPAGTNGAAAANGLDGVKAAYQAGLDRLQRDRDQALATASASYAAALDRLQQEATSRADLEGALAVKAERERLTQGVDASPEQRKAMAPRVAAARLKYEQDRKPILDDARRRTEQLNRQYAVSLDQLQRQLTLANRLEDAVAVKNERERLGSLGANPAATASSSAGPEPLKAAAARTFFQLPENEWKTNGDILSGHVPKTYVATPYKIQSTPVGPAQGIRFGFKIKAKWYHAAQIWVDGERYSYSRGHWFNTETATWANGKEQHLKGKVESPDRWYAMEGVVQDGKIRFYYAGKLEFEAPLKAAPPAGYTFQLGFHSYDDDVQIKDVSYELNPPKK